MQGAGAAAAGGGAAATPPTTRSSTPPPAAAAAHDEQQQQQHAPSPPPQQRQQQAASDGGAGGPASTPLPATPSLGRMGSGTAGAVPASRVDRLLRERIRKSRSAQALDHLDEWDKWEGTDLVPLERSEPAGGRLIVVANRLPVTCSKDVHGRWRLQISAGGLVSALMGVDNYSTLWIGWPGIYVKPSRDREALGAMLGREGYLPVWLESGLLDAYYNGFCNSVLWQLFHYVPLQLDGWQRVTEHQTLHTQWEAYQKANRLFGEVVLRAYKPGDMVWVQDYHLMLLPEMLKQAVPRMKVGWFLHTPFPSSEIYRTLPVREEVLRATLRADLIGFHTYDYARHFISSCTRILGLEGTPEGVEDNGSVARVAAFPIGIDPERFGAALEADEVQMNIAKLLNRYAGRKVMLGVDRLDMIKGIPQKLLAFEKFLQEHEEWRDKVLLVQIAVPSRTDVPEYQKLRSMVHEIVGRINGAFGTLTYVPIHHLDRQLSFHELCALYAVTDVALITSLRDGMNLVSYEYVACQADNAGVLVLSEFAGAAQSLGAGAILVNPWNINDVAAAIEDALTMSEEERRERHRQNYMHVATHTAQTWADTFISELNDTHIEADLRLRHTPPELDVGEVVRGYIGSSRRLIVLGYNATLTTAVEAPRQPKRHFDQIKALTRVNPRIMRCLEELCADPANEVLIFSGSEMAKLEETFGGLGVWLAAENGVYVKPPCRPGLPQAWKCLFDTLPKEWMESVQLVLDYFCERTPRSFVEVRDTSLVWNYKHADVEFGRLQARDLLQHLWTGPISNAPVEIIQGGRSVEVRPVGVTKGLAMQRILGFMGTTIAPYGPRAVAFDLVLCIGHLLARDENMFLLFEGHRLEGQSRADLRAALQQVGGAVAGAGHQHSTHLPHAGGGVGGKLPASFLQHHPILGAQYGSSSGGGGGSGGGPPQPPPPASNAPVEVAQQQGAAGKEEPQPLLLAPHLLQQQFPLHAICELDEDRQRGSAAAAAAAGRAAAAAVDSRGGAGVGVPSHRFAASGSSSSTAAAAEGSAAPAAAAADAVVAGQQQQQPAPTNHDTANHGSSDGAQEQLTAPPPGLPPLKPAAAATAAAALPPDAAGGQLSPPAVSPPAAATGAGVYAAAALRSSSRRNLRQQHTAAAAAAAAAAVPGHIGPADAEGGVSSPLAQPAGAAAAGQQQRPPSLQLPPLPPTGAGATPRDMISGGGGSSGGPPSGGGTAAAGGAQAVMRGLKFPPKFLFTCSVGRSRSKARFSLPGSNDVGGLLEAICRRSVLLGGGGGSGGGYGGLSRDASSSGGGAGSSYDGGGGGGAAQQQHRQQQQQQQQHSGGGTASGASSGGGVLSPSSQEALVRAIEAASALRMPGNARGGALRASSSSGGGGGGLAGLGGAGGSSSGDLGGIVSQGSLQGFAGSDALIGGPPLPPAWQQQQVPPVAPVAASAAHQQSSRNANTNSSSGGSHAHRSHPHRQHHHQHHHHRQGGPHGGPGMGRSSSSQQLGGGGGGAGGGEVPEVHELRRLLEDGLSWHAADSPPAGTSPPRAASSSGAGCVPSGLHNHAAAVPPPPLTFQQQLLQQQQQMASVRQQLLARQQQQQQQQMLLQQQQQQANNAPEQHRNGQQ